MHQPMHLIAWGAGGLHAGGAGGLHLLTLSSPPDSIGSPFNGVVKVTFGSGYVYRWNLTGNMAAEDGRCVSPCALTAHQPL